MESKRVEELLGARARNLGGALAGAEFKQTATQALAHERERALRHRRTTRAWIGGAAVAAALLLVFLWNGRDAGRQRPLGVQVAVLDAGGRELGGPDGVRGAGAGLPPPSSVHLELLSEANGFARVFLYDALGRLQELTPLAATELVAGEARLMSVDTSSAWQTVAADQELDWLIVSALQDFAAQSLQLPPTLASPNGPERRREVAILAETAAANSGCAVSVRTLEHLHSDR